MIEFAIATIWAGVAAYAVWCVRQAALGFLARQEPKAVEGLASLQAEVNQLRTDLAKTSRAASAAALAAGLKATGD